MLTSRSADSSFDALPFPTDGPSPDIGPIGQAGVALKERQRRDEEERFARLFTCTSSPRNAELRGRRGRKSELFQGVQILNEPQICSQRRDPRRFAVKVAW